MVSIGTQTAPEAGPQWLRARRSQALERVAAATLPSWEEEVWRYSPIDELDLSAFATVAPGSQSIEGLDALIATLPEHCALVVLRNGQVVSAEGDWLVDAEDAAELVGSVTGDEADLFAALNDGLMDQPITIRVPRSTDVELPVVIVHMIDQDGIAAFPRVVIDVAENSSLQVYDLVTSTDVASFVAPVLEARVADASRVGYLNVQELGPRMWQIANQASEVGSQATWSSGCAAFGGAYARTRIDCRLAGRGSTGNLGATYFGDNDQVLDFRTFQDHIGADTTSNLLFKGVLDDRSRSVYSGLIRVGNEARGTNAFQTNRNIKLSEHAWAESVPNLEIETNDVRCSHASTVGPIDEEQRFYLESRGVPTDEAERLIVAGFFDEVIGSMPVQQAAAGLRVRIAEKLAEKMRTQ